VLRSGNSGADGLHTILRAQRIGYSLLSGGIVLPDSVSNESIFVPAGSEGHAHMPYAIARFEEGVTLEAAGGPTLSHGLILACRVTAA
jgi:hypothetical protein